MIINFGFFLIIFLVQLFPIIISYFFILINLYSIFNLLMNYIIILTYIKSNKKLNIIIQIIFHIYYKYEKIIIFFK